MVLDYPKFWYYWAYIQKAMATVGTILEHSNKPITLKEVRTALDIKNKKKQKNVKMENSFATLQNFLFPKKN
jgi:chromosome segregation and condensation protein ScpB